MKFKKNKKKVTVEFNGSFLGYFVGEVHSFLISFKGVFLKTSGNPDLNIF